MNRTVQMARWALFIAYALAGTAALLVATPAGLDLLGQPFPFVTFTPAKIMGLPWSTPLFFIDEGPVATLALVGICFGLNFGIGLMLARDSD